MKFSIRDLLLVTAIAGLFFAWTMDSQRVNVLRQQLHLMEQNLASKDVELNRVANLLRLEKGRVSYYRSGIIGYPP